LAVHSINNNTCSVAIFQDNPSEPIPDSPFWILLELSMLELLVTTGAI